MPKRKTNAVTVRVRFPATAWERIERLATALDLDPPTLVRVLASMQLVQTESTTVNAAAVKGKSPGEVAVHMEEQTMGLFPDRRPQELEAQQEAQPQFGFKTRAEVELEQAGWVPSVGYMARL